MLVVSGSGFGDLGATTLVSGKDFNCNATICYGIGAANHKTFVDLQTTLNRFAGFGRGFAPLVTDGFIGDATVRAVSIATAATNLPAPGNTRQSIAAGAPALITNLRGMLDDLDAFGVSIPGSPAQPMIPTMSQQAPMATTAATTLPATTTPSVIPPAAVNKAKVPGWAWALGGVAGALAIGGIGYAVLREPRKELGKRRRRRR